MLTATASFRFINNDLGRSLETTSKNPLVARESTYYLENIGSVGSIEEFIDDDRLFAYAMRAHGLEEMTYAKAFMRKVLTEGVDDNKSFANSLTDERYKSFAETFNFQRYDDTATTFTRARQGTVDKYVRQTLETDAGRDNEGVRLALYFLRKAPEVTNPFDLLADPALLAVTQVALSLPSASSNVDIDRQAEMISSKLNIEDLQDSEKLDAFLSRFTTLWEIQNPSAAATTPNILMGGPIESGISPSLLSSIQSLKLGGR